LTHDHRWSGRTAIAARFNIGLVTDFWLPAASALGPLVNVRRAAESPFLVKARLRDGVTVAQAQAAMDVLGRRLAVEYPKDDPGKGISVFSTPDVRIHPPVRHAPICARLAAARHRRPGAGHRLQQPGDPPARSGRRPREGGIRSAWRSVATRAQIVRHLLIESLLFCQEPAGWPAACSRGGSCAGFHTLDLPITVDFGIDVRVLAFAMILSAFTGVLFGLAPALKAQPA
jgi:putative ABC transport system permease protein